MRTKAIRGPEASIEQPPVGVISATSVRARAATLSCALESGAGCLPIGGVDRAQAAIARTAVRTSLADGRTVVAFAGATGSGKSSLFNVVAGADVAQVGVRRPTTSKPTAAIWGSESPSALLDWLMVGPRHLVDESPSGVNVPVVTSGSPATLAGVPAPSADPVAVSADPAANVRPHEPGLDLDGLVLLDLPDFDSRANAHRIEADRVLDLVDVFIWVTDPQKYADARLHEDYISK